jgi:hypothetical protein
MSNDPNEAPKTEGEGVGNAHENVAPLGSASRKDTPPERILEEVDSPEDASPATPAGESARSGAEAPGRSRSGSRRLTLALLVLLVGSIAVNAWQWRQRSALETRSNEFEIALTQAVEKLDEQTVRARDAEGVLSDVDDAMGNVRARIRELQQALDELSGVVEP